MRTFAGRLGSGTPRIEVPPPRRPARRLLIAFGALLSLLLGGCNQLEGAGEMEGRLELPGCTNLGATFSMPFDFFSVEPFSGGGLILRLQQGGRGLEMSEGLMFTLLDYDDLLRRRGEALPVTPVDPVQAASGELLACAVDREQRPASCPLVRADLNLPLHCPQEVTAPALAGELVFTHLGRGDNDRVAGHFELTASDAHGGVERGELSGEFDFFVQQGHPYRRFPW